MKKTNFTAEALSPPRFAECPNSASTLRSPRLSGEKNLDCLASKSIFFTDYKIRGSDFFTPCCDSGADRLCRAVVSRNQCKAKSAEVIHEAGVATNARAD